jgi:asparagine synthase (glutamine-hydrolysing)
MSAIFGIIDFEGRPIEKEWIKSMQTDLAHRGPEGKRIYQEESMFLGHMLLQVTPESIYDKSPYEEDGFVITANARLDERKAIMDRLNVPEVEREIITDPLLLLRSFRKFGKDFVKDIYGDFAFAIWDKEKKELFCARDQIGVKPFLYYLEDNRLVFSTELKSIVKLEFVNTKVNNTNIRNDYFDVEDTLGSSIWKNVKRLIAANHLTIVYNKTEISKYWTLSCNNKNRFNSLESSANALESAIVQAIEDRMRTPFNIGVPLSGGLDSSSIACVAAQHAKKKEKNIYSFSSMLDPELKKMDNQDETKYINAVLSKETNIIPGYFYSSQLSFYKNLISKFDRYYAILSPFNYVDEALYIRFENVKARRLLSGFIGDITVSNKTIRPLAHMFRTGRILSMYRLWMQIKKRTDLSSFQLLKTQLISPLSPYYLKNFWNWLLRNNLTLKTDIPLVLKPFEKIEFHKKRKLYLKNRTKYNFRIEEHILPPDSEIFREDFDTGSSYYQLEYTYPLMDRRVLECLTRIPVEYFYANGIDRGLIKIAMKNYLPDKIRNRTDKGFYSPGYFNVIYNDIPSLIKHIELGAKTYPELKESFEVEKILKHLNEMVNGNIYCLTKKDWNYLYVCTYIIFKIWGNNEKHQ